MSMKSHNSKLKPPPRQLFSCGFFRHCTQTIHSPTTPSSPTPPPLPPPQPIQTHQLQPPPQPQHQPTPLPQDSSTSSTTTSSSSTSQSFTQWRFPTPTTTPTSSTTPSNLQLEELFTVTTMQLTSGSSSYSDALAALHSLESSIVPNPQPIFPPPQLILGVVKMLNQTSPAAKSATKILLALCLAEQNRRVAVEVGAVGAVIEAVSELERATAERALAALELMCTVTEGAAELRSHALAVPMMVEMMGRLEGHRGKEYAISVLSVIYSESEPKHVNVGAAPAEEVARAVTLALQEECSARGRRKGALLLKILNGNDRPLDV